VPVQLGPGTSDHEELRLTSGCEASGRLLSETGDLAEEQVQGNGQECGCRRAKSEVPSKHPGRGVGWKTPKGSPGSRHKPGNNLLTAKSPGDFGYEGADEATEAEKSQ